MFPNPWALRWAAVVACSPGWLRCQDVRLIDSFTWLAAAYDQDRSCIVTIGFAGETCELDGLAVRHRPLPRLGVWPGGLVRGPDGRSLLLVGPDSVQTVTSRYDGVAWQQLAGAGPSRRTSFALASDEARGEVLLFGGSDPALAVLGDTWTFDGAVWTQRQPANGPLARMSAAAAYDTARQRVVLFGGQGFAGLGFGVLSDTWEWNGATWAAATPLHRPPARMSPGLVYDAARNRTVLFGGHGAGRYNDTWEYDGIDWSSTQPPLPRPRVRENPLLVFDPVLGETVLLGGSDGDLLRDEWTWNGVRWQQIPLPPAPKPRWAYTFSDPAGTGLIVADYGQTPRTWRWDASGWTALAGALPPPERIGAATCVDLARVFLFGGSSPVSSTLSNDLWAFDGTSWSMLANGGPSPRVSAAMAADLSSGNLVLFGGHDVNLVASGDTWTFDGVAWTQQQPTTSPPARTGAVASYDLVRQRVVLFGGFSVSAGPMNDTWEWNGADWVPVASATTPPADGTLSLAFDVTRGRTVLAVSSNNALTVGAWSLEASGWQPIAVGQAGAMNGFSGGKIAHGFPYGRGLLLADMHHVYAMSAQQAEAEPFGIACTATAALLAANSWPRLGALDFAIEVVGAPANSFTALVGAVQSASLPVGPCTLLVQPGQLALLLGTSGTGFANAPLPVPPAQGLLGVELFFQAATLEAAAPAGFTLSKGLRLRLGE